MIGAITASLGVLLAGCSALFGNKERLRYQITITCETPDGVTSGSAVQEIMLYEPIEAIKPINIGTTNITGDAVVIAVGGRHYFVDLNQCGSILDDAIRIGDVHPPLDKSGGGNTQMLRSFKQADARSVMDGHKYTKLPSRSFSLTYFSDETDYSSLMNLKIGIGNEGWLLKTVVIAVTEEALTRQTIDVLPWLRTLTGQEVRNSPKYDGYMISSLASLSDQFASG
ncbi:MAG: hypothetical protein EOP14_01770 [Pseudomonas sp.]|nr:MAG: hypothetical protein EOP14_01770 [Pseudomonas sp.]